MALPTAIAFIISSTGLLLATGKENFPIKYFVEDTTKARMMRSILPAVFVLLQIQNTVEAFSSKNFGGSFALLNSITDIFILLVVGFVLVLISRSIGSSIDREKNERRRAEEALRQSEERLRDITFSMADWIWEVDENGVYTFSSKKGFDYFGPIRENVIGKTPFDFMPPDEAKKIAGIFSEIVKNKAPIKDLENWNITASGEKICFLTNGVPILDKQGNLKGYRGVDKDITQRKRTEEELVKAKEKAEESDDLKSAFLANMSHEIRTPMNGILGFAELLKEPGLTGEEQGKYIGIIEKSGERMLSIINDIISISKIESGQMEIFESDTNINEQLEFLLAFFKPEAEKKGLQIKIVNSLPAKDSVLKTDREKVYAIMTNLIKNAVKFTHNGSIEIGCEKKGQFLEFFVKDTGTGIHLEQRDLIFERFRQGSASLKSRYEGTGLGLSISKAYVEMMGGKMWIESEPGRGSSFYFTIPYIGEQMSTGALK